MFQVTFSSALPAPEEDSSSQEGYNVGDAYQFLDEAEVKTEKDVENMVETLVRNTEAQYQEGVKQLQKWNVNEILAPYQDDAQTGLTIARDKLNDAAQQTLSTVLEGIASARGTMDADEFLNYLREVPKVIEIKTKQPLIYFMEAFDAITDIGTQMASGGSEQLTNSATGAYEQLKQFGDKTSDQAMKMGGGVSQGVRELGSQTMQMGANAQKRLGQAGDQGLSQMSEMASNGAREVSQMGQEACKGAGRMASQASGNLQTMGNEGRKQLNRMAGEVSNQLPQMGKKASNRVSEMGETAYGQMSQLGSEAFRMSDQASSQLQSGMKSMTDTGEHLINSASGVARGLPLPKSVSV